MARRALLLLDGLDEGGQERGHLEKHVTEVLAPQGHVLLVTSRPAGVDEARFTSAGFRRLHLSPLTDKQQEDALTLRLGASRAAKLMEYVHQQVHPDPQTGERVTANPLMLSMFASIFELRSGLDMPRSVTGLYAIATEAMLARGGTVSDTLSKLLCNLFLQAHVAQRRVIEDDQLTAAAHSVGEPEVLRSFEERISQDALPLLSLLQSQPRQLQASHLSFQEYYAALALCNRGTQLSGLQPWKWGAWWANVLTIGAGMGETFGRGLLRAAGIKGDELEPRLDDTKEALEAVMQMAHGLKVLNLKGAPLPLFVKS